MTVILVLVAHNGRTLAIEAHPHTRVDLVQDALVTLSGISKADQIVICQGARLDPSKPLAAYKLPAGDGRSPEDQPVFLYNKAYLRQGTPLPVEDTLEPITVQVPPLAPVPIRHPLQSAPSPLVRALPDYERQFEHHLKEAKSYWEASQTRLQQGRELLSQQEVQARAADAARANVEAHYTYILGQYREFCQRYSSQHSQHSELLSQYTADLEALRSVLLPSAVRTSQWHRLVDLLDLTKMQSSYSNALKMHEGLTSKVCEQEGLFSAVQQGVEVLLLQVPSVNLDQLGKDMARHEDLLDQQGTIVQTLTSDLKRVKTVVEESVQQLASQALTSTAIHDTLGAMEVMNDNHVRHLLPKVRECDAEMGAFCRRCLEAKQLMTADVLEQLQRISEQQSRIREMKIRLAAFTRLLSSKDEAFGQLKPLQRLMPAYRCCLVECVRRKAWGQDCARHAAMLAEHMARFRDKEVARRTAFRQQVERYLAPEVLKRMGLLSDPPHCQVTTGVLDPELIVPTPQELEGALGAQAAREAYQLLPEQHANSPTAGDGVGSPDDDAQHDSVLASGGANSLKEMELARLRAKLASHVALSFLNQLKQPTAGAAAAGPAATTGTTPLHASQAAQGAAALASSSMPGLLAGSSVLEAGGRGRRSTGEAGSTAGLPASSDQDALYLMQQALQAKDDVAAGLQKQLDEATARSNNYARRIAQLEALLQSMTKQQGMAAQQNTAQQSTPQQSTPQQSTPQQSTPQQSTPQQSTPQQSRPQQQHITQQSTPQQSTPQHSTPQHSTPQQSTPQQSIAQQSTAQWHGLAQQHDLAQHGLAHQQRTVEPHGLLQHSTPQQQDTAQQSSTPQQQHGTVPQEHSATQQQPSTSAQQSIATQPSGLIQQAQLPQQQSGKALMGSQGSMSQDSLSQPALPTSALSRALVGPARVGSPHPDSHVTPSTLLNSPPAPSHNSTHPASTPTVGSSALHHPPRTSAPDSATSQPATPPTKPSTASLQDPAAKQEIASTRESALAAPLPQSSKDLFGTITDPQVEVGSKSAAATTSEGVSATEGASKNGVDPGPAAPPWGARPEPGTGQQASDGATEPATAENTGPSMSGTNPASTKVVCPMDKGDSLNPGFLNQLGLPESCVGPTSALPPPAQVRMQLEQEAVHHVQDRAVATPAAVQSGTPAPHIGGTATALISTSSTPPVLHDSPLPSQLLPSPSTLSLAPIPPSTIPQQTSNPAASPPPAAHPSNPFLLARPFALARETAAAVSATLTPSSSHPQPRASSGSGGAGDTYTTPRGGTSISVWSGDSTHSSFNSAGGEDGSLARGQDSTLFTRDVAASEFFVTPRQSVDAAHACLASAAAAGVQSPSHGIRLTTATPMSPKPPVSPNFSSLPLPAHHLHQMHSIGPHTSGGSSPCSRSSGFVGRDSEGQSQPSTSPARQDRAAAGSLQPSPEPAAGVIPLRERSPEATLTQQQWQQAGTLGQRDSEVFVTATAQEAPTYLASIPTVTPICGSSLELEAAIAAAKANKRNVRRALRQVDNSGSAIAANTAGSLGTQPCKHRGSSSLSGAPADAVRSKQPKTPLSTRESAPQHLPPNVQSPPGRSPSPPKSRRSRSASALTPGAAHLPRPEGILPLLEDFLRVGGLISSDQDEMEHSGQFSSQHEDDACGGQLGEWTRPRAPSLVSVEDSSRVLAGSFGPASSVTSSGKGSVIYLPHPEAGYHAEMGWNALVDMVIPPSELVIPRGEYEEVEVEGGKDARSPGHGSRMSMSTISAPEPNMDSPVMPGTASSSQELPSHRPRSPAAGLHDRSPPPARRSWISVPIPPPVFPSLEELLPERAYAALVRHSPSGSSEGSSLTDPPEKPPSPAPDAAAHQGGGSALSLLSSSLHFFFGYPQHEQ